MKSSKILKELTLDYIIIYKIKESFVNQKFIYF